MPKPTFVIVHGAWHRPAHFEPLVTALAQHGYRTVTPALPSVHKAPGEIVRGHHEDVAAVRQAILDELDGTNRDGDGDGDGSGSSSGSGVDVIVVPHSYGGLPASGAVRGLDCHSRAAAGHATGVVAMAAITAFVLPAGMSIRDIEQQQQREQQQQHEREPPRPQAPDLIAPPPAHLFFEDLPAADVDRWAALLNPMSGHALFDACGFSAYAAVPVHFLMATNDRAMKMATQERVVARMRDDGARDVRTQVLHGSSHSPFLSRVDETVAFLRRSAGEDVPPDVDPIPTP